MNDIIGKRFGKLVAKEQVGSNERGYLINCICDCGNEKLVNAKELRSGNNKSCGCLVTKHGMSGTRIYEIWQNMKRRCNDHKNKSYSIYGGRGITYDDSWEEFEIFYNDMKEGYSDKLTIDRIDPDGNYTKDNCRWADKITQANNTRSNIFVEYKGETISVADLCRKYNFNYDLVRHRLQRGQTLIEAIKPVEKETLYFKGKIKTVTEWAEEYGMTYHQLKKRLMRGWDVERAITQPLRKRRS